jgi:2OG-Fe(II) oxygenase superfamily
VSSTAREQLAVLLASQDELSSSVQLRAKAPACLHLEVDGIGRIACPVSADQARRLRRLGRPANFGRGEETRTDPAVRDTWEIPRELVRAEWAGGLGADLEAVREELGLPQQCRLVADLHSLLVYDKGQFFLPHQDSEKDDTMIATLVVTLPSAYTGGELVVHHLGETTTYRGSKTQLSLVAFYADCRHEVRPVTSGHRISLTYNLLLQGDPADHVPDQVTVQDTAALLRQHFSTAVRHAYRDTIGAPPNRLAFLLDHEYSESSLSWSRLKGTDVHRASLLRAAASAADCEAVIALTEIKETWDAYPEEDDSYGRSYHGYGSWDDEDEDDEDEPAAAHDDDSVYQLNELLDSSIRLTRWTDPSSSSSEDISLSVSGAEVCSVTPSSDLRPFTFEYEGYMGNYGNTLDRWYRRAAVVVWPTDRGFANRAEASPSWALDHLGAYDHDPATARTAAATLEPFWHTSVRNHELPGQLLGKALRAALAVEDADTASMLLRPFTIENLGTAHAPALGALAERYGEHWTGEQLRAWFGDRPAWTSVPGLSREQWLGSLPDLCRALQPLGDPGNRTARGLLERSWDWLATTIRSWLASPSIRQRRQQLDDLGRPLAAVLHATEAAQVPELRDQIVTYCRLQGDALTPCVQHALRVALSPRPARPNDAFVSLAADQATRLRARLAEPVRASDDWSLQLPGTCSCELCGTLHSFLADPARRAMDWPLAKDRRSHIHSRIDQADLPVTHQTRRQGRPYTLVLTKATHLFEREAQQRAQDNTDLEWLRQQWITTQAERPET